MTAPGRLAAAPQGGSEPDRATRIGFGTLAYAAPPERLRRSVPEGLAAACSLRREVPVQDAR